MKTLYLHIGSPKTGTSSIQSFCCENRDVLMEKGYCYPTFSHPYLNQYARLSPKRNGLFLQAIYKNAEGIRDQEEEARLLKEGLQKIQDLFQEYDHIVLSDEGIWRAASKRRKSIWKELREEAEKGSFIVKVIAYVRRQDELLESWWNQTVKHGISKYNIMTWEEYLKSYTSDINLDYYKLLKAAADELGVENIVVRRFQPEFFVGGALLSDFLHVLGLELTEEYRVLEEFANTKMSGNYCEIKRIINNMPEVELKDRWRYERMLQELSSYSSKEYSSRMFSKEEADDFMKKYEESNRKLYQTFLDDGQPLFMEKENTAEKWKKENPHMLTDLVRFIVLSNLSREKEESKHLQTLQTNSFCQVGKKIYKKIRCKK